MLRKPQGIGDTIEIMENRYGCTKGERLLVIGLTNTCASWKVEDAGRNRRVIPVDQEGKGWRWVLPEEDEVPPTVKRAHRTY